MYATVDASLLDSEYLLPINRFTDATVLVGFVTACLLAGSPTFISPPSTNAITEGVVLFPSALGITTGSFPSMTETQELVVPKSIPIILLITRFYKNLRQSLCQLIKTDRLS